MPTFSVQLVRDASVEINHQMSEWWIRLMEPDSNASDSGAVRWNVFLLAVAQRVGEFENQPVGVGGNHDRGLHRGTKGQLDANVRARIHHLYVLDIGWRDRLSHRTRHCEQQASELYSRYFH